MKIEEESSCETPATKLPDVDSQNPTIQHCSYLRTLDSQISLSFNRRNSCFLGENL